MVGVPGKYKGCETCRRRRVKCSNERPFCNNCVNTGRQCEGYERERVFITGTLETKGRVASHPKRTSPANKPKAKAAAATEGTGEDLKPQLVPTEPLTSAWDDCMTLSGQDVVTPVLLTGLQTDLQNIVEQSGADDSKFDVLLPAYAASEPQTHAAGGDFNARARCLVRLGDASAEHGSTGGYCAFLYEHSSSSAESNMLDAPGPSSFHETDLVKGLGPDSFTMFPNHQYFVRIYRPLAVSFALFSRCDSFLSQQDWMSTPWNWHPKSPLDYLLDIVLRLPSILAAADDLLPQPATMPRRLEAQGLLRNCLMVEMQFHEWLQSDLGEGGGEIPFAAPYAFRDGLTALMMLYYWMAQIPLHRCIESLHSAIFQPVVDAFPDMWPDPQVDPTHYQDGCELAASICRGLDSALGGTTQPDMLLAPMAVALNVYRDASATSQDGILEMLWLEAFQKRLAHKGQYIANILQQQRWVEIARY
ncbi:fungal zn(2)-Cys(6) binuclear cluster domain-containing protein [Hirsutella rhossiliensis]|uniref:Fungal zn(2)-Cys(6) binuclear cluster domain-containing protein n=1 Tax=Hirsutella rhossiliensis TaxID=111463 RepID=A0A9P8SKW1_9HYPO|nr:fungal zn(2)-Cys(6) binuclear cluster domain-containing protein [Hirsutella rhossiliensis]KAH0966828.1 fungal zn(2)-Cys(6) binuclear cluster domain-containing protein [Hirsutella rhossiliensis]